MIDYVKIADNWRKEHPYESSSGYVLIFGDIPWTWQKKLPDPAAVLPGNRAVNVNREIFIAMTENNIDRAYWKKVEK